MRSSPLFALACAYALAAVAADSPFDAFKGKMKEGLYEYTMQMDMGQIPGMPPGMAKQNMTFQHCLSAQDIENGQMGRGARQGKMPENCEIRNFSGSGNTAAYTMACKGETEITTDNRITFTGDGYTMDVKSAMKRGGQVMNTTQHMEGRYLGPCK